MAREIAPAVPFIFVSGTLGEEAAVDAVKQGATDYVLKQRLGRLPVAVGRALAEARARTAELSAVEVGAKVAQADAARHQSELDATRATEESRRWRAQADAAERETRRLQAELARAERSRVDAEEAGRDRPGSNHA